MAAIIRQHILIDNDKKPDLVSVSALKEAILVDQKLRVEPEVRAVWGRR